MTAYPGMQGRKAPVRGAAKAPTYRCSECGWSAVKWVGRCGECQAWGTVGAMGAGRVRTTAAVATTRAAPRIGEVDLTRAEAAPT